MPASPVPITILTSEPDERRQQLYNVTVQKLADFYDASSKNKKDKRKEYMDALFNYKQSGGENVGNLDKDASKLKEAVSNDLSKKEAGRDSSDLLMQAQDLSDQVKRLSKNSDGKSPEELDKIIKVISSKERLLTAQLVKAGKSAEAQAAFKDFPKYLETLRRARVNAHFKKDQAKANFLHAVIHYNLLTSKLDKQTPELTKAQENLLASQDEFKAAGGLRNEVEDIQMIGTSKAQSIANKPRSEGALGQEIRQRVNMGTFLTNLLRGPTANERNAVNNPHPFKLPNPFRKKPK